jgi:hypothetical protein
MALCDKTCNKCVYRGTWPSDAHPYCRYLEMTGHKRPCPAGAGCTAMTTRTVYRRKKRMGG